MVRIQRRNPHIDLSPNVFPMCMGFEESGNHLFLHFSITAKCWNRFFQAAGLFWARPLLFHDFLFQLQRLFAIMKEKMKMWDTIIQAVTWSIWKKWNHILFHDWKEKFEGLWTSILRILAFWVINCEDDSHNPCDNLFSIYTQSSLLQELLYDVHLFCS